MPAEPARGLRAQIQADEKRRSAAVRLLCAVASALVERGPVGSDASDIEPKFPLELPGWDFVGRDWEGISDEGWPASPSVAYRCAACGVAMRGDQREPFECRCGAMVLDPVAGRFGSKHGDRNILVYRSASGGSWIPFDPHGHHGFPAAKRPRAAASTPVVTEDRDSKPSRTPDIVPTFSLDLKGFELLGRGPFSRWPASRDYVYRCVECGTGVQGNWGDDFFCRCGALQIDYHTNCLGSASGVNNILMYRRLGLLKRLLRCLLGSRKTVLPDGR
jgi:hypothetical protein